MRNIGFPSKSKIAACFRGIYEVINKNSEPKCMVVEDREDNCIKCHMCTTACKLRAITID